MPPPQRRPGHYYHFLALVPPARLSAEAKAMQEDMARRFGAQAALRNPPHFTLVPPFEMTPGEATELAKRLATLAQGIDPVSVEITGFGAFAPRVIFLDAEASPELLSLAQALRSEVEAFSPGRIAQEVRSFHPHLTLAYRDLTPEAFRNAWCEYRDKRLEERFLARTVTLFRHDQGSWHVLRELPLRTANEART